MDSTHGQSTYGHLRSIKLWPPSQTTRQVLVDRIVKNLTTPSILSRKYGLLSKEEAEEDAKQIESAAFSAANQHFEKEPDSDGASTVQVYARESSKLMVEVVKRGPRPKEDRDIIPDLLSDHESVFDISGGRRAFIDAEEAKELLKPLKEPENKYTKICFSNRSFGLPAAHVAASILSNLKNQLTEVDLSDFVSRRPEPEAIEVMRMFSSALEGCDLSYLNLSNNTLGERGIRAFGDLLRSQENLVELYLMNAGISEEAAKALRELIPSSKKLKILHFHNNMIRDGGAIAISQLVKESPMLEDFRCSLARIGSVGGVALAEALATCTLLKKLDLRDNVFGTEAGIALSRGLSGHANLIEIHLGHLNLEDEAAIAILNALETCPSSIEALEMAGNAITSEAAPAIAACITSKKDSLTKLNLSENELKDAGAVAIGRAVAVEEEFGRLMMVDLSSNGIGSGGARILAKAVAGKPVFRLLNINGNFISNKGIEDVREIFQNSPRMLGPLDANNPDGEDDD
ncbi:RAN GTPase-activating protein 2-like [Cynara cardunculus var. scolymus]|uniref:RAN GTPase-activating protein 2-like n=1 Tax=Cynara cardunculus var. scolymus TaxID=59895 RepID=UPI000D62E735|nr:RAN GTPase-activating protein 2-like [Cynara cardunculus var. scolymus]